MTCPHCSSDDEGMMDEVHFTVHMKTGRTVRTYYCNTCGQEFQVIEQLELPPEEKV